MTLALWILLGAGIIGILAFVVYMKRLMRESRELQKKVDPTKLRKWKDDE